MKTSVAVPVASWQATEQVPSLQLLLRPLQSEVDWRRMVWFWVRVPTMGRTTRLPLKQVRTTCLRAFGGRAGLWLVKGRISPRRWQFKAGPQVCDAERCPEQLGGARFVAGFEPKRDVAFSFRVIDAKISAAEWVLLVPTSRLYSRCLSCVFRRRRRRVQDRGGNPEEHPPCLDHGTKASPLRRTRALPKRSSAPLCPPDGRVF